MNFRSPKSILRLVLASLSAAPLALAGGWAPTSPALSRYEEVWKASPFVVSAETAPQAESLAQRYALNGLARIGNQDVAFLLDRKTLRRFSVTAAQPENGVELIEVQDNGKDFAAKIRVGAEVATLRYQETKQEPPPGQAATQDTTGQLSKAGGTTTNSAAAASAAPKTTTLRRGPISGR